MRGMLLPLHLVGAGLWTGCILVEVAFERALAESSTHRPLLAELHRKVDLLVELTAFSLVLLTGAFMLPSDTPLSILFLAKLVLGIVAVLANIYCLWLVLERKKMALLNNDAGFAKIDHQQHRWGAVVLVSAVMALLIGLSRFAFV